MYLELDLSISEEKFRHFHSYHLTCRSYHAICPSCHLTCGSYHLTCGSYVATYGSYHLTCRSYHESGHFLARTQRPSCKTQD